MKKLSPPQGANGAGKNGHAKNGQFLPGNKVRTLAKQKAEVHEWEETDERRFAGRTPKAVVHEAGVSFKRAKGFLQLEKIISGVLVRKVVAKYKDKQGVWHVEQAEEGPAFGDIIRASEVLLSYWKGKPPQIVQHTGDGNPLTQTIIVLPDNGRK